MFRTQALIEPVVATSAGAALARDRAEAKYRRARRDGAALAARFRGHIMDEGSFA